ncbi:hypothetical protein [Microbacterium sp. YY-01]|uniref:hypothetical protein n=1 Tax=Microbacterium sp. YY-01 TaxID=3421634 RepID=UPI003D176D8B
MSLLDRKAPHTVQVLARKRSRNDSGLSVMEYDGEPVSVRCMVEPVRDWSQAEENVSIGLQVIDLLVIRARHWPGDIDSHVVWEGSLYETVGAPQHHSVSKRTRHWRVTIKWIRKVG